MTNTYVYVYLHSGIAFFSILAESIFTQQLGGPVCYRATGDNFTISQNGADINKMEYEYDEQGNPVTVTVAEKNGGSQ